MGPGDWISLADWVTGFRARHADARRGKLDAQALARYEQDREVLAKALLIAQRMAVKPGQAARQTLRVLLELPVEIVHGPRREKATTYDLGMGGFAVMLQKPFSVPQKVTFTLGLGSGPLAGKAKVVNLQRKGRGFRVAFSFDEPSVEAVERVGLEVFEGALATIPPR